MYVHIHIQSLLGTVTSESKIWQKQKLFTKFEFTPSQTTKQGKEEIQVRYHTLRMEKVKYGSTRARSKKIYILT